MSQSDEPHRSDASAEEEAEGEAETALDGIEEVIREKLGLYPSERPALYEEMADAATDTDTPFWTVLLLSGAIASLGLILDSTAVVIGAMLVAPLLGPLLGISLALAVGDGRLFVQTMTTMALGVFGIVALAALITVVMPFHEVTAEIASRTRPTTLDLAIAVASGLAGAVVTVTREKRLSASIPGVAVAVALVPPLGVAGFGVATGDWSITWGSMLLFGANLAGIVLSALIVLIAVGMYRPDVVEAAKGWHGTERAKGISGRLDQTEWLRGLGVFAALRARILLAAAFVGMLAIPLYSGLQEVLRERRVASAVNGLESALTDDGRGYVINRSTTFDEEAARVTIRLATTERVSTTEQNSLALAASRESGEEIRLNVEQMVVPGAELAEIARELAGRVAEPAATPAPATLGSALEPVRAQLADALAGIALPDSVQIVGATVTAGDAEGFPRVELAYLAPGALPPSTEAVLIRQLARDLAIDAGAVRAVDFGPIDQTLPDSLATEIWSARLLQYPRLRLAVSGDSAQTARVTRQLLRGGAEPGRARQEAGEAGEARLRVEVGE